MNARACIVCILLGGPPGAAAASPGAGDASAGAAGGSAAAVELAPVVVEGSPEEAPARDTTPVATAVTTADAALPTLASAVAQAPGALVRRTGGHREELQLRGAGAGQLAVFLDDVPLTGARGGAFDLSLVPPDVVDRVEVLRGPNAASYGGGALGGVLHLHTRPVGRGHRRAAELSLGSHGESEARLAEAFGGERADVLALAGAARADGDFPYEDIHGTPRRRRNNDRTAAHGLLRGRLRLAGDATATLLAFGLTDERGEPGVEQFEALHARAERRRLLVAAAADDPTLVPGALALGVSLYYTGQTDRWRDPAPTLWGAPTRATLSDDAVGGRGLVTLTGLGAHLPRLAVEARRESAVSRIDGAYDPDRREDRLGAAAVVGDEWATWGERLVLAAALRLDDHDGRAPLLVPQAGLLLAPAAPLTLRANVGRVFRDPSFDELYTRGPGLRGNPELRPEDGLAWDAGLSYEPWPGVALEGAVFGQRYERLILFLPVQAHLIEATGDHGAEIRGQEAGLRLARGPLRATALYTHLDARFTEAPRSPLPYRPAHRLYAEVRGRVQRAWAFLAADARSEVRTDRFGHRRSPGHTLWDFGLRGPLGADFEAGVVLRNLLDRRDATDAVQQPLPGRTWLFTLRYAPEPTAGGSGEETTP